MRRYVIERSGQPHFIAGKWHDIPHDGRAYRSGKPTRLAGIAHESVEETVIVTEAPTAAGGPMAMNRYIR